MGKRQLVETTLGNISKNPVSQAIRVSADEWLFCSGQLGIDPITKEKVAGGAREETIQVMENIKAVLLEAGTTFESVIKTTVFVTHLNPTEMAAVNEVYQSYFSRPYPSRSLVEVAGLNANCKVEIECIALLS